MERQVNEISKNTGQSYESIRSIKIKWNESNNGMKLCTKNNRTQTIECTLPWNVCTENYWQVLQNHVHEYTIITSNKLFILY